MRLWLPTCLALWALTACTSGTTASAPDAGAGAPCPAIAPVGGSACSSADTVCEYAGDGGTACNTFAGCNSTDGGLAWRVTPPSPTCWVKPAGCPTTFNVIPPGACATSGVPNCTYPEGECACAPCLTDGGTSQVWKCLPWSAAGPGCPAPRPLLGSACSTDQLICDWDHCCKDISMGPSEQCVGGHWQLHDNGLCSCAMPACP